MKGRKVKKSLHKRLLSFLLAALALWLAVVGAVWIAALSVPPPGETDAMIVLGAQVLPDGTPNSILLERLQKALAVYQQAPCLIVCCGAKGTNEPAAEGDVMRAWLIEKGAAEKDVIAETGSQNTYENLENARALLPDTIKRVLILTSDYHLPRALMIARDKGFIPSGIGSDTFWLWRFKNHTREALSLIKYFWLKILGRE